MQLDIIEECSLSAAKSRKNFSVKHFSVIAFLKKLVTLGLKPALHHSWQSFFDLDD